MLQIIGTKDKAEYRKAVRFCKERRIPFQEVSTKDYKLSMREWDSIFSSLDSIDDIIDKKSNYYIKNGYAWREYDPKEEVMEHPLMMVNPVLRNRGKVNVGFSESFILENAE